MTLRKKRLTLRKNAHSKAHIARAKRRQAKREEREIETLEPVTNANDCAFLGFDVPPLRPFLRVLSVFDGIATALFVLEKLNLHVECYYSCEIDDQGLELQKYRFGQRIHMLGSVQKLTDSKLRSLGEINLLIGGSPCSDLSLVNPRRRGLSDPTSTGALFFEYTRIRDWLKNGALEKGHNFFWLFENTAHMERRNKCEMSRHLGCQPVERNASQYLPVERRRLFWSNIPEMYEYHGDKTSRAVELEDILPPYRQCNVKVVPTLTTTSHSQRKGKDNRYPVRQEGKDSSLFITEIEALFGFPKSFTDGPNLTISQRRRLLGKAFCVPVIEDILRPLTAIFSSKLPQQVTSPQ